MRKQKLEDDLQSNCKQLIHQNAKLGSLKHGAQFEENKEFFQQKGRKIAKH